MNTTFSESELTTIRGALELARDKYRENAKVIREPTGEGKELAEAYARLGDQFDRQSKSCVSLLEKLELLI